MKGNKKKSTIAKMSSIGIIRKNYIYSIYEVWWCLLHIWSRIIDSPKKINIFGIAFKSRVGGNLCIELRFWSRVGDAFRGAWLLVLSYIKRPENKCVLLIMWKVCMYVKLCLPYTYVYSNMQTISRWIFGLFY